MLVHATSGLTPDAHGEGDVGGGPGDQIVLVAVEAEPLTGSEADEEAEEGVVVLR